MRSGFSFSAVVTAELLHELSMANSPNIFYPFKATRYRKKPASQFEAILSLL